LIIDHLNGHNQWTLSANFSAHTPHATTRRYNVRRTTSATHYTTLFTKKSTMGGHHYNPEAEPKKDQNLQAIKDARTPLAWRDTCSHILVDLNKCRRETWWNPNKCEHARHVYEECEYNAYLQRIEAKVQLDKLNAQE
jgi:NADH dehydrogenase (ubiquinone) 1 beta subcomplex subunit 7